MRRRTTLALWTIFDERQRPLLSRPATDVDLAWLTQADAQRLIDDMLTTMRQAEGVGLAAPQVGQGLRLAVISPDVDQTLPAPLVLVNPVVQAIGLDQEIGEEGCLSIPGVYGLIQRARQVQLTATDRTGQPYRLTATGLLARVIQHEVDHVRGVLMIDRAERITHGQNRLS